MPLVKSSLASALADLFTNYPASKSEAGQKWAQAYVSYASAALSPTGGTGVNAMAGLSSLASAFTSALQQEDPNGTAGAMATGVQTFWQSISWVGAGTGTTIVPGNVALTSALAAVFSDLGQNSASDKADRVADAFDGGAKSVIVLDIVGVAPPVPTPGPIQ
jgi:hypothetical protein